MWVIFLFCSSWLKVGWNVFASMSKHHFICGLHPCHWMSCFRGCFHHLNWSRHLMNYVKANLLLAMNLQAGSYVQANSSSQMGYSKAGFLRLSAFV
jgi:hypothetical protein